MKGKRGERSSPLPDTFMIQAAKSDQRPLDQNLSRTSRKFSTPHGGRGRGSRTKHRDVSPQMPRIRRAPTSLSLWPLAALITQTAEESMVKVILRWPNERGMMRAQPSFRLAQIKKRCMQTNMTLLSALSLRRHHIHWRYRYKPTDFLALGSETEKREAAMVFEGICAAYLALLGVNFKTEKQQRQERDKKGKLVTPDFILEPPLLLTNGQACGWIEVKHFYGAGSLSDDGLSACGRIPQKSKEYVKQFGPGAYLFAYGCSESLKSRMDPMCVVLDAAVLAFHMEPLWVQLRTWCANDSGVILP
jgi:hypothetical protein